jgi:hypothetical protein
MKTCEQRDELQVAGNGAFCRLLCATSPRTMAGLWETIFAGCGLRLRFPYL